ncbi:biopolymer transporter ExbD [Kiloniella laminariae]|uniref:biopolymer transporter ExbD n=1 Tax=Kiloniella laminariae TaxID=454162 RepID=UPI0003717E9F|nr:biopolymer transporter ExbD [Kiloniella laminariae]
MIDSLSPQDQEMDSLAPDLTPMLDVLFILLVFLILTANSVNFSLEIALPKPQESVVQQASQQAITITLHAPSRPENAVWEVAGTPYHNWGDARASLQTLLRSAPEQQVVIAGDKAAPIENLVQVLSYLEKQGRSAAEILLEP